MRTMAPLLTGLSIHSCLQPHLSIIQDTKRKSPSLFLINHSIKPCRVQLSICTSVTWPPIHKMRTNHRLLQYLAATPSLTKAMSLFRPTIIYHNLGQPSQVTSCQLLKCIEISHMMKNLTARDVSKTQELAKLTVHLILIISVHQTTLHLESWQ